MNWTGRNGFAFVPVIVAALIAAGIFGGAVWFFHGDAKVVPVDENVCQCSDLEDMKNRIAEAGVAARAFGAFAVDQATADMSAGTTTMYNRDRDDQTTAVAQGAVTSAHKTGTKSGKGKTQTDCVTKIETSSACIRQSLQLHENVHSETCQAIKAAGKDATGDFKDQLSLVQYWAEEVKAYSKEIEFLTRQIARVTGDPACAPPPAPVAAAEERYPGTESKEDQKERLAGASRRVLSYVSSII
jgi:hypothetical protein